MSHVAEYEQLLKLFVRLVQAQAGRKIDHKQAWLNDAQVLAIKLFRHLISMRSVAAGAEGEFEPGKLVSFIDHASVKVLARAALETYLVFFYIYGGDDQEVAKFRHMTWHLGGLRERQRFFVNSEEGRKVQTLEKVEIEQLTVQVGNSSRLQSYPEKQRKKLLLGDWRVGISWIDLGVNAGFHKKYFSNVYWYLCGYSHSSYLSALQVGQAQSKEEQEGLTQSILGVGLVLMSHFAFTYSRIFPAAEAALTADTDARETAEMWRFGPEDLAEIYDQQSPRPKSPDQQ